MNRADPNEIYALLAELGISYRKVEHEAAASMEALQEQEQRLSAEICKNLFLCNRQKTVFYLLLIRENKRFRTSEVSKLIGSARLSFGEEDKLFELLGVYPGSISPLGLVFDREHQVHLLIDRELLSLEELGMHPCRNTATVAIRTKDLLEIFFPFTGHIPQVLDITGVPDENL